MAFDANQAMGVLDAAFDPSVVIDRSGRIAFASKRIEALLGFTPEELIGQRLEALAPPRLRGALAHFLTQFFLKPAPLLVGYAQMIVAQHKNGSEIPIELGVNTIENGRETSLIVTFRDVSQRVPADAADALAQRRMQERLAAAYEHFRVLIDHTPAAVAMLDREMRYFMASRRWSEDYGLGARSLTGLSHYEMFPDLPEQWVAAHRRCLAGETVKSDDDSFIRADGAREYLRWELVPWNTETNEIGGMIIFSEITTRRRMAELAVLKNREVLELEVAQRTRELQLATDTAMRANALKSRFVAAVSHDLRQPLHVAGVYLTALERRLDAPDQRDICTKAEQAIDGMTAILEGLLDLSRLEGGVIRPHPKVFAVRDIFARVIAGNMPRALAKGLTLLRLDTDAIAWTDPMLLERILDNFVSNAIRYTAVGSIRVGCESAGGSARIFVSDTGIGIAPEAREKIFEEHVQLANPSYDRTKGFGLGLSIAKDIADALGCTLELESNVGQGSVFAVSVPLATLALAGAQTG